MIFGNSLSKSPSPPMKTRKPPLKKLHLRGFTLVELLVVISLIAVLAALVISGAGGIMKKIKRDQIRSFMAEIQGGLEDYKVDNAIYPLNPDPRGTSTSVPYTGPDSEAVSGAATLYKHLSGDFDTDGQIDADETAYVDRLDYWSNSRNPPPEVIRSVDVGGGTYLVVDPLGSPIRYIAYAPGLVQEALEQKKIKNPTYDLWSIAGAEAGSTEFTDEATWITNWGTN